MNLRRIFLSADRLRIRRKRRALYCMLEKKTKTRCCAVTGTTKGMARSSRGEGVEIFLERLKAERTVFRLVSQDYDYERLVIVVGLARIDGVRALMLGPPPGFPDDLRSFRGTRVRAEFSWREEVPCEFISRLLRFSANRIWISAPERIEKMQRRRYPRATPPEGSLVRFRQGGRRVKAALENLGVGGALVLLDEGTRRERAVATGRHLSEVTLDCRTTDAAFSVWVGSAEVNRGQGDNQPDDYTVAIKFLTVEADAGRTIESFVASCRQGHRELRGQEAE